MSQDPTDALVEYLRSQGMHAERLDRMDIRDGPVWTCKIGLKPGTRALLPGGADMPMRLAVERAFGALLGVSPDFCFSGWGGELDAIELEIVNERTDHGDQET